MVIFPGILAVEDDGHQRIAAGCQNAGAVVVNAVQEIVGGRVPRSICE